MSDIQRYDTDSLGICYSDSSGPYVLYTHHKAVIREALKKVEAENKTLRTALGELQAKAVGMYGTSLSKSEAAGWTNVSCICEQALEVSDG